MDEERTIRDNTWFFNTAYRFFLVHSYACSTQSLHHVQPTGPYPGSSCKQTMRISRQQLCQQNMKHLHSVKMAGKVPLLKRGRGLCILWSSLMKILNSLFSSLCRFQICNNFFLVCQMLQEKCNKWRTASSFQNQIVISHSARDPWLP